MKRIIFSRHGIRYPFLTRKKCVEKFGKDILDWDVSFNMMGRLTEKGELIEYMYGKKLKDFLQITDSTSVKITANSIERTYMTAKLISTGMLGTRDFKIKLNTPKDVRDANYELRIVKNEHLDPKILEEVDKEFKPIYKRIEDIFELTPGLLTNGKSSYSIRNTALTFDGPFMRAAEIAQLCSIKYLLGIDQPGITLEDIKMMGRLKGKLLDIASANVDIIKENPQNAYNLIKRALKNKYDLTLIVGHDANIATILSMMGIKVPENIDILETYPLGVKLLLEVQENGDIEVSYLHFNHKDIRDFSNLEIVKDILGTVKKK